MTTREIYAQDKEAQDLPRPPHVIADRYRQGARCLALFRGTECIGFIWFVLGEYIEDEVRCVYKLDSQCAWDFDVYIEPKFRLGRAFARLWDSANQVMAQANRRWTLSRISAFNPGSLASHAKLGATKIGSALFLKIGSAQLMLASRAPYIHISLNAKTLPELSLHVQG